MTDQLALFADPAARRSDPATSTAAAGVVSRGARRLETLIVAVFDARGAMTDDQLVDALAPAGYHGPTVKTARSRLARRGLLVDTGEQRRSTRGRPSTVWATPEQAHARADLIPQGVSDRCARCGVHVGASAHVHEVLAHAERKAGRDG